MGSCCFAPTRRQFLWWYWLLLVSIVGIPMLLAVLYVSRQKDADEATRQARGKTAAAIFWGGTFVVAVGINFVLAWAFRIVDLPEPSEGGWFFTRDTAVYWRGGYMLLALQFFAALVAANLTNDAVRKLPWYGRILLLVPCLLGYLAAISCLGLVHRRPAINVMHFLACMLPAHYWRKFKDVSNPKTAWHALGAFVVGAILFSLVSYWGEPFAQMIVGAPTK
jgi:hypothetical protein